MMLQGPIIMKQTLGVYGDPFSLYGKKIRPGLPISYVVMGSRPAL
jgi:hypothetical protein